MNIGAISLSVCINSIRRYLLLISRKIHCFMGDPPNIKELLNGINYRLSLNEAQKLIQLICQYKQWPVYNVTYTEKKTKNIAGTCWMEGKEITIHKPFRNVQTVIHEISHHKSEKHDVVFKRTQESLINLFKTTFKQQIFKGENDARAKI